MAELVSMVLGQPVTVLNHSGAGGTSGLVNVVRNAAMDGYTLGIYAGAAMLRVPLMQKTGWHPLNHFTFIAGLVQSSGQDVGLVVRADAPWRNAAEWLDAARSGPGQISYGSIGVGSTVHLAMERLAQAASVRLLHVPYKGSSELMPALLGGHVHAAIDLTGGWEKLVDEGKLRLLLTFGREPASRWPTATVPVRLGYDLDVMTRFAIVGPAGIEPAVVAVLQAAFHAAGRNQRLQHLLAQHGQQVWPVDGTQVRKWMTGQFERERQILAGLGLLAESSAQQK